MTRSSVSFPLLYWPDSSIYKEDHTYIQKVNFVYKFRTIYNVAEEKVEEYNLQHLNV